MNISSVANNPEPLQTLKAHKLYMQGQYEAAIPILMKLVQSDPNNWPNKAVLAACFLHSGNKKAARSLFKNVYEHTRDDEFVLALEAISRTSHRDLEAESLQRLQAPGPITCTMVN